MAVDDATDEARPWIRAGRSVGYKPRHRRGRGVAAPTVVAEPDDGLGAGTGRRTGPERLDDPPADGPTDIPG
jgi:hypothetical protein